MVRLASFFLCALLALACTGDGTTASPPRTSSPAPSVTKSVSSLDSPSRSRPPPSSASPTPPGAVLVAIPPNTPAQDVDPAALAPEGSDVTGHWIGRFGAVEHIVVAVAGEGDAFTRHRALWSWAPAPSLDGWLGVPLLDYPARNGVLNLDAVVGDVTGDSNDDVLVFALTGGSGACGIWTVVDLAMAGPVYERDLCDGTILPAVDPVGLRVVEAVFRPGDAHCCPSARRETVLTYDGSGGWDVFRRGTTSF